MRTPLVVGNWKMNLTSAGGESLVEQIIHHSRAEFEVDVAVCPPYLSIPRVADVCRRSRVKLGAQDVFWVDQGAYTGQVSPKQLDEFHVAYCIVGHSETRGRFGASELPESTVGFFAETDETINLKMKSLLFHGIIPILCVGETKAERESGLTEQVIRGQLEGALATIEAEELFGVVIAYEPVWAIGTGETCDAAEAQRVCAFIRQEIRYMGDGESADAIRILYGGSVKPDNAKSIFAQPDIDGGLIGGASLDAKSFVDIVTAAHVKNS